jgi:regulator of nucleoside diphosphate kinase
VKQTMNFKRYLTQHDATLLSKHAENLLRELDLNYNCGEQLIEILKSSVLLHEKSRRDDCVSLYSEILYERLDTNDYHVTTIVIPSEASAALARISALAPLSLALIGRRITSEVDVELYGSYSYRVRIVAVNNIGKTIVEPIAEQVEPLS